MENIWRTFPSYVFGELSLGAFGHLATVTQSWIIYVGAVLVLLTNTQSAAGRRLAGRQRLFMFLMAGAAAVFIWTALYISYSEPGNTYIDGVQGRYYIPVSYTHLFGSAGAIVMTLLILLLSSLYIRRAIR